MGLFDDIKKAVWAAKSVGKNKVKEAGKNIQEASKEVNQEMKDFGEQMVQTGKDAVDAAKHLMEDVQKSATSPDQEPKEKQAAESSEESNKKSTTQQVTEAIDQAVEKAKPYVDQAKKAAEPYVEKAMDFTEEVGKEVMDKGGKVVEKAADVAENLGAKVLEFGDILKDQAKEVSEKLKEQGKSFYEKAQEEARKEKAKEDLIQEAVDKRKAEDHQRALDEMAKKAEQMNKTGNQALDNIKKTPGLDGFDDFFSKASRFADGDYHNTGKQEEDITIDKTNKKDRPDQTGKLPGFKDNDGDGNELIDDAIVED